MKLYNALNILLTLFIADCYAVGNGNSPFLPPQISEKAKKKELKERRKTWQKSLKDNLRASGHKSGLNKTVAINHARTPEELFINAFAEVPTPNEKTWFLWQPDGVTNKAETLAIAAQHKCEPALLQQLIDAGAHTTETTEFEGQRSTALWFASRFGNPLSIAVLLKANTIVSPEELQAVQKSSNKEAASLIEGQLYKQLPT